MRKIEIQDPRVPWVFLKHKIRYEKILYNKRKLKNGDAGQFRRKSSIRNLTMGNGKETTEPKQIMTEIHNFYSKLYD